MKNQDSSMNRLFGAALGALGFVFATLGSSSTALGTAAWVSHYIGPAADEDVPAAIVTGIGGRTTVAGASMGLSADFDFVTVQYDANGAQNWAARYDGGAGDDAAMDVWVDADDSATVTGSSAGADSSDYATVRYDASGTELWVARYAGPGGMDEAVAVEVDGTGNTFVTGTSQSATGALEIATVKYDVLGSEVWVERFGTGTGFMQEARDLLIAPNGDAIVIATVGAEGDTSGTSYDYLVLRYATDSTLLWSTTYDGPDSGYDEAQAGAVDEDGQVYVTGVSEGASTGLDYATIKLSATGALEWDVRHDGTASGDDAAFAVDVLGATSTVVTGSSTDASNGLDFVTIRYDEDGNEMWSTTYDGPSNQEDIPYDVAFGPDGSAYVSGASWAGDEEVTTGIATLKYSTTGTIDWIERYDVDDSTYAEPSAIAVDAFGNAFVAATVFDVDEGLDYVTLAYGGAVTDVPDTPTVQLPARLALAQNVPNPVVGGTRIDLALPHSGHIRLRVFNVEGREVTRLLDRSEAAGYHHIQWDTSGLAAGTYFYRAEFGGESQTRKMVILE